MADNRGRGRRGGRGPSTSRGGGGSFQQLSPATGRGSGGRGQQPMPSSVGQGPSTGRGGGEPFQLPSPATGRGSGGRVQQPIPSSVGQGRGTNVPPPSALPSSAPAFQPASVSSAVIEMEQKLTIASSSQPPASVVNPPGQPQLSPVSAKNVSIPLRPGFGTIGKKIIVKANHFLVNIADRDLHHYDVAIMPEITSKPLCREIMAQLVKSYQTSHLGKRMLAYDGRKSVYTAGNLPFASKDFVVKLVDKHGVRKEREFKVSIKFAAKVDIYHLKQFVQSQSLDVPHETLQALDVVLREKPSNCYEVVGRSFFHPKLGEIGDLGNGIEYWKGFYQSLRPIQMGLSLNIDMSSRAFFQPVLVSAYVAKHFTRELNRPLSDQDRLKVKKTLRGVKVVVNYQKNMRRYKISGVSTEQIQQLMFTLDESETKISVAEYFRQTYKITLKYPFLPALQAGSDTKPVYLPMELCQIVEGQRYSKKLNERQIAALLKATCQRPNERERSIADMVKENNYNADKLVNEEFGIHVKPELISIEARVLPPPMLLYHATGRESRVEPRVGQWNMIDKKMVDGGRVEHWACVNFSRSQRDPNRFINELIDMCNTKGMEFNPKPLIQHRTAQPNQIEKTLYDIHAESCSKLASMERAGEQLQLLFIILPDVSGSYGRIKCVCETELGIVSQCCQPKQTLKLSKQYMENVSLKINVKVGGRNTVLEMAHLKTIPLLSDRPTIIFGADVTHPQPGEDSSPSIAAVVASMDWPKVTMYRGLVSAQAHREEIIQDLYKSHQDPVKGTVHSGLIREHLVAFYKKTRTKPARIIFYRDGVSEGQFNQVLLYEIDAIRKACITLEENYLPRITFVVVQKRHHTRLFPNTHGDRNSTDRSGNILPGTVVDTKICHPNEFDFYLCSHAGIQGTSRPTHYHVLYDENGFNANCLQMLTNSLCYTYARCTRSVSIVPPAYYAHLAAFRARYYIEGTYSDTASSIRRGESGAGATREKKASVRPLPVIKDNVKDVMFYC